MTAGNEDGVASVDGMMEPEELAEVVVKSIEAEDFLILPHPQVLDYMRNKTADYGRWIGGMRKLQRRYPRTLPNLRSLRPRRPASNVATVRSLHHSVDASLIWLTHGSPRRSRSKAIQSSPLKRRHP